ncbi:P-loop containing nucleoside triphosphate hydrolase protein [Crassisporium funariophilum]|nr:P-loop containing nucleoside triphosphate hydrolase protein [Crassisporium funariophilum]
MEDTIPHAHGFILMYSITSRNSFQDIARTCRQIPLDPKRDSSITLILVGSKSDQSSFREVTTEEGVALAEELGCYAFYETSARTGDNVDAAIISMVRALRHAAADRRIKFMTPFRALQGLMSRFRVG